MLIKNCKERFGELTDYARLAGFTDIAGEIIYLDGAEQPVSACNSLKSAFELLDRRSANYSDRPRYIIGQEILSGGLQFVPDESRRSVSTTTLSPIRSGDHMTIFLTFESLNSWRRLRRAAHEALTKGQFKTIILSR